MSFHNTVMLVPWTPEWRKRFEEEKALISDIFEKRKLPAEIHHTGSTSITGMWSKPIIDVLVIIPDDRGVEDYEEALMDIGYDSLGECGRPDRVFLSKGETEDDAFYLHLTYADNPVAQDQLLFQFISFSSLREQFLTSPALINWLRHRQRMSIPMTGEATRQQRHPSFSLFSPHIVLARRS